jgi:hypothetical protein
MIVRYAEGLIKDVTLSKGLQALRWFGRYMREECIGG